MIQFVLFSMLVHFFLLSSIKMVNVKWIKDKQVPAYMLKQK